MVTPTLLTLDEIVGNFAEALNLYEIAKQQYKMAEEAYRYWEDQTIAYMERHHQPNLVIDGILYRKVGLHLVGSKMPIIDYPTAPPPDYGGGIPTPSPMPSPTPEPSADFYGPAFGNEEDMPSPAGGLFYDIGGQG